ncbi:hypothetical protein VTO42DRAFT_7404 [Malbranchea cinnamomea]
MFSAVRALSMLLVTAWAGEVLWDGRFNDLESSGDLLDWSWESQVGPYQYYIHGSGPVTQYVNLDPSFKNPADNATIQGAKITIDSTAKWNSDMWRTELIPQTDAPINSGHVYYHFSMMRKEENAPNANYEHQVCFFESHFTEMKYGWINGDPTGRPNYNLQWMVGGQLQWQTTWEPDIWHNIVYDIDFDAGTVSFYHSTGSDPVELTAGPVSASTSSNGADWHLGVLRLPRSGFDDTDPEDWYFSGVYVETGPLTTSVTGTA